MSNFVNVGAYVKNARPKTKAALKAAVRLSPQDVYFDGTSPFSPGGWTVDDITANVVLQVTGPDPYTRRNWYASVTRNARGLSVK